MIEQKKKLRLDELQVESFVTSKETNNEVQGGSVFCIIVTGIWVFTALTQITQAGYAGCNLSDKCNGSGPNPPQTIPGVDCPPEYDTQTVGGYDYNCR